MLYLPIGTLYFRSDLIFKRRLNAKSNKNSQIAHDAGIRTVTNKMRTHVHEIWEDLTLQELIAKRTGMVIGHVLTHK